MLMFLIICCFVCCISSAPQVYENQEVISELDRSNWNEERLSRVAAVEIERNSRIVGGSAAQANQFQHAVALFLKLFHGESFCGGSIIHQNFILTAAHCLDDLIQIEVFAGTTHINRGTAPYRAIVPATDTLKHERYNRETLANDIGLVCVRTAIPRTATMSPVRLPAANLVVGSQLRDRSPFVIGWGRTSDANQNLSNTLQFANLEILPEQNCVNVYNTVFNYFNPASNICISGARGSTCNGDSGGSATLIINGLHTLVGVVSFGSHSCQEGHPIALVRVTAYVDWINRYLQRQ